MSDLLPSLDDLDDAGHASSFSRRAGHAIAGTLGSPASRARAGRLALRSTTPPHAARARRTPLPDLGDYLPTDTEQQRREQEQVWHL